ncbi:ATP-binding cassette domain-containing protein [Frigidibacter sp. MR17.24]|uniref:ATP-binding cassette domain-containing protein n=1 Tax=Frigidibacter sp. MR17.24 TaxID=3127345 RepID=UPI003012F7FC
MTPTDPDRLRGRAWRPAVALALAGLACALLLGGLSGWFLSAVALAGLGGTALVFDFHTPGALVRLFAIGRTAARYGERLAGHRAALSGQILRRAALFRAMAAAPATRAAGWQLGDQGRLTDFLDDVDDLDFAPLRVGLPRLTLLAGAAGLGLATLVVVPLALLPIAAATVAIVAALTRFARGAEAALAARRAALRDGAAGLGAAHAAVVALRAEGRWTDALGPAAAAMARADARLLALRVAQARIEAGLSLAGPLAGATVLAVAWAGGARSGDLLAPVFLAFAWLAFAETLLGAARQALAAGRRRIATAALAQWTGGPGDKVSGVSGAPGAPDAPAPALPDRLETHVAARAPDGRSLAPAPVAIVLERGRPLVLTGASGSGKTSLLKQLAGWTGDEALALGGSRLGAPARRALVQLCLHDAAILADSLRANLFAPGLADAQLWEAIDAVEMRPRVEAAGGLDGWISQEMLSLGEAQRLNLARVWLGGCPVVALDEPLEHLDRAQGARIVARLLARLADRHVVIASHQPLDVQPQRRLDLSPPA